MSIFIEILEEINKSPKTALEKFIDIIKNGSEQDILKFLIDYIHLFKNCRKRKRNSGISVLCSNQKYYVELPSDYEWGYFEIEGKEYKLPKNLYVYDGKTLKPYKEIDLRSLIENLIENHKLLKR
jgi:hypothetical protein